MKRMKIYLVAALYCLVVSCTTSKKIEQDDDFATEATDATLSAEPTQPSADVSEFDLDEKATNPTPPSDVAAAPVEKDEFADFNDPAAQAPADSVAQQTPPAEKDEFAEFDNPQAAPQTPTPNEQQTAQVEPTPAPQAAEQPPVPPVADVPAEQPPLVDSHLENELSKPIVEAPPVAEIPKPEIPPEPLVKIEQVFYKPNQNGGAVTIEADKPPQFTTRLNSATNQLVVEIQNSVVPSKLKRSLNTKDMASSIGSVDIYQKANSKVARFVVQLRPGAAEPLVQPEGNSLLIIGAANEAFVAKQKADAERAALAKSGLKHQEGFVDLNSDGIMNTQTLEEFLVGNQKFYGKRISIETNNVDVKEAIKFIAEESGANLLMDDGLEGKISLKLRQVPWDQALILILKAKKLGYVRQGNVLRIAKLTDLQNEESEAYKLLENRRANEPMIVKRFFISYAKLEDMQTKIRDFMVATAPVTSAKPIGSTAQQAQTQTIGAGANPAAGSQGPVVTAPATTAPGSAGAGVAAAEAQFALQNKIVLGRVIIDQRTGSLIVTDTKENMSKIEKLIAALDTQPKQIVLETRIVNATETFSKSLGFNWVSGGSTVAGQNSAAINITTQSSLPKSAIVNSTFSWKNLDVLGNLDAIIALGEIQDKVKVLNTQRTTVSSGQTATIGAESKLRIPIVTTSAVGGTGSTASNTSGFETVSYGLKGKVVPQASNENTIFADLNLTQVALTNAQTGDTTNNDLGGQVLAQSGQTIAVNASFQSRNGNTDSGIPGLRDVPVLGSLFKAKSEDLFKAETLVFMTMTILEPVTGVFKKAAGEINSEPTEPEKQTQ